MTFDFYWDLDSSGQLIKVAEISVTPPREKQRTQGGQVKHDYVIRRKKNRKNKRIVKLRRKRYYRRNKRRILRYQKRYRKTPQLFKRRDGAGIHTRTEKNKRDKKTRDKKAAMYLEAIRSVMATELELEGALLRPKRQMKRMTQRTKTLRKRPDNRTRRLRRKQYGRRVKTDAAYRRKRQQYAKNYYKLNKHKIKQHRKRGTDMSPKLSAMQALLAILRSAHWSHWTSHWQVQGMTSYGDHILMEKLYTGLVEEIDTLAEKIVGEFGGSAIDAVDQAQLMAANLITQSMGEKDPLKRALLIEENLQKTLKAFYDMLKSEMSLGLDDFVMSLSNAHETNLYLLRQRHR